MKFNVGDTVRAHNNPDHDGIIVDINEKDDTISVKPFNRDSCSMGTIKGNYPISHVCLTLLYKKLKATKIARKVYAGKIVRDLGDYIEVKCEI